MVTEPLLGPTAVGPPSPHYHPFSMMQKGLYLEKLWMQREVLTQPSRLLAAVTSSCPQPRRCQTEERRVPATNSKIRERRDAKCHPLPLALQGPRDSLWASPSPTQTYLCTDRPLLQLKGQFLWKGVGGGTFHAITAAVSVGAASVSC